MKLALITEEGVVITLIEEIEEYNLDKGVAKAEVIQAIQDELERLRVVTAKDREDMHRFLARGHDRAM